MKKLFLTIIVLFFTINIISCAYNYDEVKEYNYEDVCNTLIRFHVRANSDSAEDQELKLKVKDKIIEYLYPLLEHSESLDNTRKIIENEKDKVEDIARNIICECGYKYEVSSKLSRENFPDKQYGNIILPQGEYEAYVVVIGEGKGQNWWCVLFPPLCFIDITQGEVYEEETKKKLDEQLSDEEIEYDFKIIEIIKELFSS